MQMTAIKIISENITLSRSHTFVKQLEIKNFLICKLLITTNKVLASSNMFPLLTNTHVVRENYILSRTKNAVIPKEIHLLHMEMVSKDGTYFHSTKYFKRLFL